ncbi:MAG: hypothetical protein PHO15_10805 [Eubacteriales bacterium]|nr:hypothetical protein [Eubacteriales bacterium]
MSRKKELSGLITGLVAIVATACFLVIGFLTGGWHPAWLVFLAIPITGIIGDLVTKGKDVSVTGLIAFLAVVAYLVIGFKWNLWHPGWILFFAIPIAGTIENIIKKKDISGAIIGAVALLCTVAFLIAGFFFDLWHIAWVVFLLIPIISIIINIIKVASKKDEAENKDV